MQIKYILNWTSQARIFFVIYKKWAESHSSVTLWKDSDLPVIFPLASEGGCQLTMMVRGLFSLLTTVTSFGEELGTVGGLRLLVYDMSNLCVCLHTCSVWFSTCWTLYVLCICGLLFITGLYVCVCVCARVYDPADVIQLHTDFCAHTQTPGWAQMKTGYSLLNINKRKPMHLYNSLINHSSIISFCF